MPVLINNGASSTVSTITHVNTQTGFGVANTASVTVTKPTGLAVGDVMLAFVGDNLTGITAPAGWTLLDSDDATSGALWRSAVYYKVATGSEGASYNFTSQNTGAPFWVAISAYRGVDPVTPVQDASLTQGTTATTLAAPSVTTTSECLILTHRCSRRASATIMTYTGASGNERFSGGNHGASTSYTGATYDSGTQVAAGTVSGVSTTSNAAGTDTMSRTIALAALVTTTGTGTPDTAATIAEDVSDPAVLKQTGTGTSTTASFTPPAGSLVLALVGGGWKDTGGSFATDAAITDSSGAAWTRGAESLGTSGSIGGCAIAAYTYFAASPGAITVSAAYTDLTGGRYVHVLVLTGARPDQSGAGSATQRKEVASTTWTHDITTTAAGSRVYGVIDNGNLNGTFTANGNSTVLDQYSNSTNSVSQCSYKTSADTASPGAVTVGATSSATGRGNQVALEILPGIIPGTGTPMQIFVHWQSIVRASRW